MTCENLTKALRHENNPTLCPGKRLVVDSAVIPFPWKLYSILEEAETNPQLHSIVSWFPNGFGFIVHDSSEFFEKIMKIFFKTQSRYQSFTRQLYIYGFSKLSDSSGPYFGGFFHPKFTRHDKQSYLKISRDSSGRTDRRYKKAQPTKKQAEKKNYFANLTVKKPASLPSIAQCQAASPKFVRSRPTGPHCFPRQEQSSSEPGDVSSLLESTLDILDEATCFMSEPEQQQGLFSSHFSPSSTAPTSSPSSQQNSEDDVAFLESLEPRLIEEMMAQPMK